MTLNVSDHYFDLRRRLIARDITTAMIVEAAIVKDVTHVLHGCDWVEQGVAAGALVVMDKTIAADTHARSFYETTGCSRMLEDLVRTFDPEMYSIEEILLDELDIPLTEMPGVVLQQSTISIPLVNGYQLCSGWIDKDDPNAMPAGDYLSVLNDREEQVFYIDAADLFADFATGRAKLFEMLQACLGVRVTSGSQLPTENGLTPPQ